MSRMLSPVISSTLILRPVFWGLFSMAVSSAVGQAAQAAKAPTCAKLLRSVGSDPLKLGMTLMGSLPEAELNQALDPPAKRVSLEVATAIAEKLIARAEPSGWHQEIPSLFQNIRLYPGAVLNDIAVERGLDQGLWESVVQSFKVQNLTADPARITRAVQWIRQGLGYLSLSGSQGLPGVSSRLKAQFISQVVMGRFGAEPWNAAGKYVINAIPQAERAEVDAFLKQAPAAHRGFIPTFDPVSGEWGMKEPETGLVWFNASRQNITWKDAKAYCESKHQSLPTREQWQTAENHGVRDVFPEMKTSLKKARDRWFWSSTPAGSANAYVFFGYYGYADQYNRNRYGGCAFVFARCVSATPRP